MLGAVAILAPTSCLARPARLVTTAAETAATISIVVCGQLRHSAEHLGAQRENEREPVVSLHPADRNAHELSVAVQHASPGNAGMPIRQARDEIVRRAATNSIEVFSNDSSLWIAIAGATGSGRRPMCA
jgi:hypothetical protein